VLAGGLGLVVALGLMGPTLALEVGEPIRFRAEGLSEAGVPRNQELPSPEALVASVQIALRPGDTWALHSPAGTCAADPFAYQWVAFRLHPAVADCAQPDVVLSHRVAPPARAPVVDGAATWVITR
jgi:hypothetical protein